MLAGIAAATLVRPFTGALFGIILGSATCWQSRRDRPRLARILALCGLFAGIAVGVNGVYNRATTGRFDRFPYAMYDRAYVPQEIVPDLASVESNLKHGPSSTWQCSFPLLFVAAGFALWRDRERRAEAIVLAALFLSLVAGYALNRWSWGTPGGCRFYFEAYTSVGLLGARGVALFLERRDAAGRIAWYLGPLAATSILLAGLTVPKYFRAAQPYIAVRSAVSAGPALRDAVVFMKANEPAFYPKFLNVNQAQWQTEPVFYAPDPGLEEREGFVRGLGRSCWVVVSYDTSSHRASLSSVAHLQ